MSKRRSVRGPWQVGAASFSSKAEAVDYARRQAKHSGLPQWVSHKRTSTI
jgi:hypothetical protein